MRIGDITIEPVYDGTAKLNPDMFNGSDWTEHQHLLDPHGDLVVPVGAFLVRTGDQLGLLDAGVGDFEDDIFVGGELLKSLESLGVTPDQIDAVIVSHLHSDHVGWLATDGEPTFANATVHLGAADWEYFVDQQGGGEGRADHMRVVEDQVSLVDRDGVTLLPGVTTRQTPGHTPGHLSSVISSGNDRMIVLGDALHCPAQLTEPEWEFFFDVDPAQARQTRNDLLREAEVGNTSLLPCHFPGMQAARLVAGSTDKQTWVLSDS